MADIGAREYTPAPVWVPVTAHRDPRVALAMFGLVVEPQPTDAPAFVSDQPGA
jgi:hypothetical protein